MAVLARRATILLLLAAAAAAEAATVARAEGPEYGWLRGLLADDAGERRAAADRLIEAADPSLLPGAVDALFFIPRARRAEAYRVLRALAGDAGRKAGERYQDWVALVGRSGVPAKAGYLAWKAELFARIDPRYRTILYPAAPQRLRLEEVVSGGVGLEGIPALDRPAAVPAGAARLAEGEAVFGVSLGGEQRAYPLRMMDWHEMLNDEVGGQPITLSYCTLCGSGVLFSTRTPAGKAYTFGTSGLLYRSNKLMVDRQTLSLWSNLTGEPVVGRLAASPVRLPILPLTRTTWKEWRTRHPATTVIVPDPETVRRWGFDYRPGAANQRRSGVRFPVPLHSDALKERDEVYAVRLDGRAKAYPLELVLKQRVVNDRLGEVPLVLVGDPASESVRAYRRGELSFRPGATAGELLDASGRRWTVGEEALSPPSGDGTAELGRVPGHTAFWFGWYAFFPDSELYGSSGQGGSR